MKMKNVLQQELEEPSEPGIGRSAQNLSASAWPGNNAGANNAPTIA